ncbi:hypothetical protein JKF63_03448 [Porcisia hertigi]|uniref:Uncharacterized protein n=1 Tax=Porcisia hertigi TaxID=2761500 RepID=A0A836HWI4_9TRYP|nr:hypothetical protein JKF63_03448 [Porcisia hertigi]
MLYEGHVDAGVSRPPYTARPRWSHNDDESVTVVQSTHDYTQHIFKAKPQTALWVRGLAEDDEQNDPIRGFTRCQTNKWMEMDESQDESVQAAGLAQARRRHCLFYPNLLAIVYLCVIAARMINGPHLSYRLDYPTTTSQLELHGRRYGENGVAFLIRVAVPLAVPHAVGAAYTLSLSHTIGKATRSFTAFCGVGLSLLSLGALFTQCSFLFACCGFSPSSRRWECELPLALHHVCSVIRVLCPLLAVWCVSPVLDQLRGCGCRWRCVLAVPCVVAVACLGISLYHEMPLHTMIDVAHMSVLLAWSPFVKSCWGQRHFAPAMLTAKLHKE